ncbi:MAG: prolipoprotein diacylglyceryl transferase [Thermodesulfobacteriota bacterium]
MNLLDVVFYIQLAMIAALFLVTYVFVAKNGELKKRSNPRPQNGSAKGWLMYPELISIGNFSISASAHDGPLLSRGLLDHNGRSQRKKLDQKSSATCSSRPCSAASSARSSSTFSRTSAFRDPRQPGREPPSRGGLTFYGGFFGAIILTWIIAYRNKISMWTVSDLASRPSRLHTP